MPMVHATTWRPALHALEGAASSRTFSTRVVRTRAEHVLAVKGLCTSDL